jgi:hypothetical protein
VKAETISIAPAYIAFVELTHANELGMLIKRFLGVYNCLRVARKLLLRQRLVLVGATVGVAVGIQSLEDDLELDLFFASALR